MTVNRHKGMCSPAAGRPGLLCLSVLALLSLGSCKDSAIFDYPGDCSVNYVVRFHYDYNMKWADAIAHEVEYVTLYLLDEGGNVAFEKTSEGEEFACAGYSMTLDVDPGQYSLLAWAGTKENGSFTVSGTSFVEEMTCSLSTRDDGDGQYVDGDIDRLFYGWLPDQTFSSEPGTYVYDVSLIKDTNHVILALMYTSGEDIDCNDYIFKIQSANGLMAWDNSLIGDETVTYYAWFTGQGNVEVSYSQAETRADGNTALAEMTVGRLVDGVPARLTVVSRETGSTVFSYSLVEIAKLFKGYYNKDMDDQEFLDRQDEYDVIVFLDKGSDTWSYLTATVDVLAWKVVLQNTDL
ncbi:MAG: FimB/Mfa2 family fimbrial subunit [Porphyromonadaceae bacterium]|nr:FimB/Mfa2 family fimbrial subunit [Porphyromonadaceae bacterium]